MQFWIPFARRAVALATVMFSIVAIDAAAADRSIRIEAPREVRPGSTLNVPISVITQMGNGEKIGFLHAEYSVDEGKTWTAFVYDANLEGHAMRRLNVTAGEGGTIKIRVRVAFRGGASGDVDYLGKPIDWEGSWTKWAEPPALTATIRVVKR